MWTLNSNDDAAGALLFRLAPDSVKTLGRAPGADFIVDAALVSRLHCRFIVTGGGLAVEDLGSTNGTLVNGQKITAASPLATGDRVQVGRVEFVVGTPADDSAGEA
jgi:pSer/pThr/pTyr-binding forkhead associated (FHA) protein